MKRKTITDTRLIAGLFREAMFQSRTVQIEHGDVNTDALITELEEPSTRDRQATRYLHLTLRNNVTLPSQPPLKLNLKCAFLNFAAVWSGELSLCPDGQYKTQIPDSIEVRNARNSTRHHPVNWDKSVPVLVQTANYHAEGRLLIENFSQEGFGATLTVTSAMPIISGTTIRGSHIGPTGTVRLNSKVVQVNLLEQSVKVANDSRYRIGLSTELAVNESIDSANGATIADRRRHQRVPASERIQVISPLNSSHVIELQVKDASTSGFACHLTNPADASLLPAGIGVAFNNSSLLAEIVSITERELRFQFIQGNEIDRLSWLKLLTRYQNPATYQSIGIGTDLIDLFCESGATSSAFIKNQRRLIQEFSDGISSNLAEQPWIHRWIERSPEGEIKGHISAVKFADSLWHIGDVAGSNELNRKISRTLIPRFCASFREHCISSRPCPKLLFGWNSSHRYWQEFESFIANDGKQFVLSHLATAYQRLHISKIGNATAEWSWNYNTITAENFSTINEVHTSVTSDISQLLRAFDFDISTFSSPALSEALLKSNFILNRQYILFENSNDRVLVIFQTFPIGASPNRTFDVPWIIPIAEKQLSQSRRQALLECIHSYALKHGFTYPGVLEVTTSNGIPNETASKTMSWVIAHPDLFLYFARKK